MSKEDLIKLWKEYKEALKAHSEAIEAHRDGWIGHIAEMNGFIDYLEKGYIDCKYNV